MSTSTTPVQRPRWLHIGAGSFHRAHQAVYLNQLRQQGGAPDWTLAIANIRNDLSAFLTQLAAQNGRFTLETVTPEGERAYQDITAIDEVISWDEQLNALIAAGADPATRIISFTVTEGGYYLNHEHQLDLGLSDLKADLEGAHITIYGTLRDVLRARMAANGGKVTLLNCDNLRHNGERFRQGMLEFVDRIGDTALAQWIRDNTTSPNCMVDRITPRPTPEVVARVKQATGRDDPCALMAESFIQWVVEDDFANGRPELERVGVEMVASVQPYEEAKIRILNASHSCVAWAGTLVGLKYIHEDCHRDDIRQMALDYVTNDVIPCLTPSPLDLNKYRDMVMARFGNPAIQDSNQRVAADGYSKIPGFIMPTILQRLEAGAQPVSTAILPALFFVFLKKWASGQLPYAYQDGIMDAEQTRAMMNSADPLQAYCEQPVLWGALTGDPKLKVLLSEAVTRVEKWLRSAA